MQEDPRLQLGALLKGQAEYLRIKETSKAPVSSFKPGRRNRYKRVPKVGNYGILPQGRLVVLDVDVHKGGKLAEQIMLFSSLLGVDLDETLSVRTPSGGRHFYLMLPDSIESASELPKSNLRALQGEIQELSGLSVLVDADIRSEAVNAYVVGPGSQIKDKIYAINTSAPISTITLEGYDTLVTLKRNRAAKRASEFPPIDLWADEPLPETVGGSLLRTVPVSAVIQRVETALGRRNYLTYHQKRAFVKAALHCCYSNDAIAQACVVLGVNKDSSSSKALHRFALQKDIHSFAPDERFHGPYCPVGQNRHDADRGPMDETTFIEYQARRVAARSKRQAIPRSEVFKSINPRVLDLSKISSRLTEESARGVRAKQYQHAMLLVEELFQPLANVGAEKMLLSQERVATDLGLTRSQVTQAVRALRLAGIIEVRDRQTQGFAPTYVVHPQYIHRKLTFHLKRTWRAREAMGRRDPLVYSPREGGLVTALDRESVVANTLTTAIAQVDRKLLELGCTPEPGFPLLTRYLGAGE